MTDDRLNRIEKRVGHIERRVRDVEWECKLSKKALEEWEPVIDAARDQEYLRKWIAAQELRESKRMQWRASHVIALFALGAAWMGGIAAVVAVVVK